MSRSFGQKGFTLLETVAALAVLAVALSASLRVASEQTRNAAYLRDRTLAHWVALNQATERRVRQEWPEPGVFRGSESMAEGEWHWTVLISTTPEAQIRRMEVLVRSTPSENSAPLARLESFLVKP